jgi:hypothetical protein
LEFRRHFDAHHRGLRWRQVRHNATSVTFGLRFFQDLLEPWKHHHLHWRLPRKSGFSGHPKDEPFELRPTAKLPKALQEFNE